MEIIILAVCFGLFGLLTLFGAILFAEMLWRDINRLQNIVKYNYEKLSDEKQ